MEHLVEIHVKKRKEGKLMRAVTFINSNQKYCRSQR